MKQIGKVTIVGMPYRVLQGADEETEGVYGRINHTRQVIVMNDTYQGARAEETLLHEVLHAVSYELSLKLSESMVTRISQGLYSAGVRATMEPAEEGSNDQF